MYAKTLNGEHVNPTAMGDFLKTFVDKGKENLEAIAEIDKNILEVKRMIEKESAKAALKIGRLMDKPRSWSLPLRITKWK
jgi:hypothetical protein